MRSLTLILGIFLSLNSVGQLNTGVYRQSCGSYDIYLKLFPDKTFSFHDIRDGSCWLWNNYKGYWNLKSDTLILSFDWKYLTVKDSSVSKNAEAFNYTEVLYTEVKKFSIRKDKLTFLFSTGKDIRSNWGHFKFLDKNYNR